MKVYVVIYRNLAHGIVNPLDSIWDSYEKARNHVKSNGYTKDIMGSYDARLSSFVADNGLDVADIFEVPVL